LSWQLAGMARHHLQAAQFILRRSLTKRMGFLTRVVDTALSETWLHAFAGFCAWTLERMLHLHGCATAATMKSHLLAACTAGDNEEASSGSVLVLPRLGPPELTDIAVPLRASRLPERRGGLGMPLLGLLAPAAYTAQACTTLRPAIIHATVAAGALRLGTDEHGAVTWFAQHSCAIREDQGLPPIIEAVRRSTRALTADGGEKSRTAVAEQLPASLLRWAADTTAAASTLPTAVQAIYAATAVTETVTTEPAPPPTALCLAPRRPLRRRPYLALKPLPRLPLPRPLKHKLARKKAAAAAGRRTTTTTGRPMLTRSAGR
jgi:hypothetical protein